MTTSKRKAKAPKKTKAKVTPKKTPAPKAPKATAKKTTDKAPPAKKASKVTRVETPVLLKPKKTPPAPAPVTVPESTKEEAPQAATPTEKAKRAPKKGKADDKAMAPKSPPPTAYQAPLPKGIPKELLPTVRAFVKEAKDSGAVLVATTDDVEDCGISLTSGEDIPCFAVAEDKDGGYHGLMKPDGRVVSFPEPEIA